MEQYKQLNIKSQTYYFLDDMTDIRNFQSNSLKIDKKPYKYIDIYYIGYITIKKLGDCENIHSVNPLYLIIHPATGYFKEKNSGKCLILDSTEKHEEEFFLEFYQKLKQLMVKKNNFIKKIMLELELIQMMRYL